MDWESLSTLYRVAPLGDKPAARLKTAFGNSLENQTLALERGYLVES